MSAGDSPTVRQATPEDREAVVAFTENTWPERGGDYIPRVYDSWMEHEGGDQRTLVLDAGTDLAGVCQGVLLSDHEAWAQAMRINPDYRGQGVSPKLTYALFDWAADRGATVCRNMVFSWNAAGLGQSRSVGFDPCTEFRWAHPTPNADATAETDRKYRTNDDPNAAWTCFRRVDGSRHLRGLTLDMGETWALSELTPAKLSRAAAETTVLTLVDHDGAYAMSFRVRDYERENDDGETERWAEYGVGVWSDLDAARGLFAAIARDAASIDADRTRVLIPETAEAVSDTAYARVGFSDEPDFVLEKDLTGR
jgi:GNAT superfamily N-acetyltransferase